MKPTGLNSKKTQNIIGNKYGELTVKAISDKKKYNRVTWICECSCGEITEANGHSLKQGRVSSCGGSIHRKWKNGNSWMGYEEICKKYFSQTKRNAALRKLTFEITIEEIWQIALDQNRKCALTGVELTFDTNNGGTASLDRIDSKLGYTKNNVQWVHKTINLMKLNLPQDEFINLCKLVANHN